MRHTTSTLLTLAFAIAATACASNVERHWGNAQRANAEAMIANPLAPLANGQRPAPGLDGVSADIAVDRMRQHETGGQAEDLPSFIQIGTGR